jgi:hypothetical protein
MPAEKNKLSNGKINGRATIGSFMRSGNSIAVTAGRKPHKDKNCHTALEISLNWKSDKRLEMIPNAITAIKIKQIMRFISFKCIVFSGLIATKKIIGITTKSTQPKI